MAHLLTPMLVQYLVGLCCAQRHPDAVDVILGDMVVDDAAEEERDVDVTVTLQESPTVVRGFKGYEAKREKEPLDVTKVEQLCKKLLDMTSLTHRAIVSTSGFTAPAKKKGAFHGVELFELKPWTQPEFSGAKLNFGGRFLLCWREYATHTVAPGGPESFNIQPSDPILTRTGERHPKYRSFDVLKDELLLRSTEILIEQPPIADRLHALIGERTASTAPTWIGDSWPMTHSLDVRAEEAHLRLGDKVVRIDAVTISGTLQWQVRHDRYAYYALERTSDGDLFANALITLGQREGQMQAFVAAPGSMSAGIHLIQLADKHLNAIRKLRIEIPAAAAP